MSLEFQAAAAQRMRRMRQLVVGLVVLVVVLAGGVLALTLRGSGGGNTAPATAAPASTSAVEPTATITPDASFVTPTRWISLPRATSTRLGLPTGYEHTPQGAIAAAAAQAEASTTWDLDAVDRAAQAYVAPADREHLRVMARTDVTALRVKNGLPGTGPVPAGTTLSAAVIGVSWTVVNSDLVQVFLLTRTTYSTPGADQKTLIVSSLSRMVWTAGDWYTTTYPADEGDKTPPLADLGSAAFNEAGWTAIQQGSAG